MTPVDDLVAQYRDLYHGTRKPLMARCDVLRRDGAPQDFVARIYERDLGKALQRAGWTRQMFDRFSTIDMLQRLHRVARKHPDRVHVQMGVETLRALTDTSFEEARFLFERPDGSTFEVQGSEFPELRCPARSEDRDGLDPLPEADEATRSMGM